MKTKRFFQLSLAVAATAMLAACGNGGDKTPSSPTQDGTISNIQVDSPEISMTQPVTVTADYTPSKNINPAETKAGWYIYSNGKPASASITIGDGKDLRVNANFTFENNKLSITYLSLKPGNYKIYLYVTETINKVPQEMKDSITFTVNEKRPDIRNSFWGDSKELCEKNLKFFKTSKIDKSKENTLAFAEYNGYGTSWDASPNMFYLLETRMVIYKFKNNKLSDISYVIDTPKPGQEEEKSMVDMLRKHVQYVGKDYYTITPTAFDYEISKGKTLTPEETAIAEEFKKGGNPNQQIDMDKILEKAVVEGRVNLFVLGKNATGATTMYATLNNPGDGLFLGIRFYNSAELK